MDKIQFGTRGESLAKQHLVNRGYIILEENWRFQHLELDLIVADDEHVVFVEVKTSLGDSVGRPEWQIKKSKVNQVRRMAQYYLTTSDILYTSLRIDILCIDLNNQYKVKDLRYYKAVGMDFS